MGNIPEIQKPKMINGEKFYAVTYGHPTLYETERVTDGSCFHPAGVIIGKNLLTGFNQPIYPDVVIYPYSYQGFLDCCQEAQNRLDLQKTVGLKRWREEVLRDNRIHGENTRIEAVGTEYSVQSIHTPQEAQQEAA